VKARRIGHKDLPKEKAGRICDDWRFGCVGLISACGMIGAGEFNNDEKVPFLQRLG